MMQPCSDSASGASGNQGQAWDTSNIGIAASRSDAVRKVVQIVETDSRLVALCSDGSIWVNYNDSDWKELAPPPGCGGGG
jgi:hypothetical protein